MKNSILLPLVMTFIAIINVSGQSARDPQTTREAAAERERQAYVNDNPQNNPFYRAQNSNKTSSSNRPYNGTKKEAFRSGILATLTDQDLTVSKVIDGDTLEVSNGDRKSTLRIVGIDAPEDGQPGWQEAKDKLTGLLMNKTVTIKYSRFCPKQPNGTFLTRVSFNGEDIGTYLLKNGFAWYDDAFEIFFSEAEHKANIALWKTAHESKLGIWKDGKAEEPWEFAEKKSKKP